MIKSQSSCRHPYARVGIWRTRPDGSFRPFLGRSRGKTSVHVLQRRSIDDSGLSLIIKKHDGHCGGNVKNAIRQCMLGVHIRDVNYSYCLSHAQCKNTRICTDNECSTCTCKVYRREREGRMLNIFRHCWWWLSMTHHTEELWLTIYSAIQHDNCRNICERHRSVDIPYGLQCTSPIDSKLFQ